MAEAIFSTPIQNAVQKQLDSTLAAGANTIVLSEDVSALFTGTDATHPCVCVIDRIDANGNLTPTKREYIKFTGVSTTTLTGCTRNADASGSDQEHAVGAIVEFVPDVLWAKSITDNIVDTSNAQTITNKTLTAPKINEDVAVTSTATEINLLDGIVGLNKMPINAPEGFLINGKIVPSVADNDLTVALKGLDGNDPSATNPVYCRIGDTVHAITAALSVTKADGTNWFNAGSAELATKEIDYFVYLGYNATDGVVIGFSRIPYATQYDQFSATAANEKYCGISTITNAAAGDDYTVVGRFAATLSAGAGYTWTVPTFTTINLIQRPIFETRWLTYVPTLTWVNAPTSLTTHARYKFVGDIMILRYSIKGTANGSNSGITANITVPIIPTAMASGGLVAGASAAFWTDNSSYSEAAESVYYSASNITTTFLITTRKPNELFTGGTWQI